MSGSRVPVENLFCSAMTRMRTALPSGLAQIQAWLVHASA